MTSARPRRSGIPPSPPGSGFSLVEALFASLLVLSIAIATLPLFDRAMTANVVGLQSTMVSNLARSRVEEYLRLCFNCPELTVGEGSERSVEEYYSPRSRAWLEDDQTDGTDPGVWTRRTVVRQYGVAALDDGRVDISEALPAGADATSIHVKEIEVQVVGPIGSAGPTRRVTLRTLKAR